MNSTQFEKELLEKKLRLIKSDLNKLSSMSFGVNKLPAEFFCYFGSWSEAMRHIDHFFNKANDLFKQGLLEKSRNWLGMVQGDILLLKNIEVVKFSLSKDRPGS